MHKILLGRPQFNDWARALDRLAANSRGAIQMHALDDDPAELISYARRFRLSAIIPTTYEQMRRLHRHHDDFAAFGCKLVCSRSHDLVDTFDDKVRFIRFMEDYGHQHLLPEVYVVNHEGERTDYAEIRYPCIFKHALAFGGTGSSVHLDPSRPLDLSQVPPQLSYIVQAYIPGSSELGGHLYVEHGSVRKSLYYLGTRDPSVHIQRGRMGRYERLETIDQAAEIEDVFAAIDYTGFACVDFKIDDAGGARIFEINPRLGGTLVHDERDLLGFLTAAAEA